MAIWLPRLPIERWLLAEGCTRDERADRKEANETPFALISENAHGQRIEAVTRAGLEAGVRKGMRLVDARMICPGLAAAPFDHAGDIAFLERLALWAQRWGPWTALDLPDDLLADASAVGHLFGGERKLLADVGRKFADRGLTVRLAIAPTSGAALALAHCGSQGAILREGEDIEARLADLPVAALRLDEDVLLVLKRLGLKRIGDVSTIGRDALHRRFRNRSAAGNPLVRLDQLLGRLPEPLLPVVDAPPPLVQRRLLEPIRHRDLLDQVLRDLADDMARELERRGAGARRLELGMWRVDGRVVVRSLELSAATREAGHISRLFMAKLDDVDAGFGIETVRLRATWAEPLGLAQQGLGQADDRQGTSLATCIDRLTVRLGEQAISRPVPYASHIPERAQKWVRPVASQVVSQEVFAFHDRPLKLLDKAESILVFDVTDQGYPLSFRWRGRVHEIARVEGPERIAPEWWRERSTVRLRDYYRVEDTEGRRYWIYRHGVEGDGRGGEPQWFLQGLCA